MPQSSLSISSTFSGPNLLELVHRTERLGRLAAYAQELEEAAEHLAVVYAYREVLEAELGEGAGDDRGRLGVVHDVELTVAYDVDIRLVELAEAAALGPLAAPDLAYLIAAEGEGEARVIRGDVLGQRDGEVKAQREVAVALHEAVYLLLRLAAALREQHLG